MPEMNKETKERLAEIRERENAYCSAPGCGYPDGKPCIKCGRTMTVETALKKRFDIPFLLTLLDQAQRDTERLKNGKVFAEQLVCEGFSETSTALFFELQRHWIDGECYCLSRSEGGASEPCAHCTSGALLKKLGWDGDVTKLRQALDQAALARGGTR